MASLYEAGDALVAVAVFTDGGCHVLGSGVMIGPGLAIVATHVLDECRSQGLEPVLLTFLPDGARAWLPRESSSVSGPSKYRDNEKIRSDITLLGCTLNSDAAEHHPLTLAPLQVGLPLVGERLWAFGYRHSGIDEGTAQLSPLVSSGLVTAAYPRGRGERMPSVCVEVDMDTKGGMSGGPVVNADGDVVGIVSSSLEGGPSYVTLVWEALRMSVFSPLSMLSRWEEINLIDANDLGLVRIKGRFRRSARGTVTLTLSAPEVDLIARSEDPPPFVLPPEGSSILVDDQLEEFEERWIREIEEAASDAALAHLSQLSLPSIRSALALNEVPSACLDTISSAYPESREGLEDTDLHAVRLNSDGTVFIAMVFDVLTVDWTVEVPAEAYAARAQDFDAYFINASVEGATARMELFQRWYFEAELLLDREAVQFPQVNITYAGVKVRRKRKPTQPRVSAPM
ncbi:serine protease [Acidovorax sp. NPDC077693]|uniref:S1 family peptidase n=1 Tax=unclassified Acidovorax TaxID=2684926 RepID=UPI0037CB0269